jgi:hypothetical protein
MPIRILYTATVQSRIDSVMASMLASSGFEAWLIQTKYTLKLVFVAFPLSTRFVQCKAGIIISSSNVTCSRHDIAEKLLIWR